MQIEQIKKIFNNKKTTSNNINYFTLAKNDLKKTILVQTNAISLDYN